jgi:hypothetical protein
MFAWHSNSALVRLVVLAFVIVARSACHLSWPMALDRSTLSAPVLALHFNVFLLVVQAFERVPPLKALAPTQSERATNCGDAVRGVRFVYRARRFFC